MAWCVREGFWANIQKLNMVYVWVWFYLLFPRWCFFLPFLSLFHSSMAPAIEIGGVWPPLGIETFSPWEVPLLNTLILLTSGATVTVCHNAIIVGEKSISNQSLFATIFSAIFFYRFSGIRILSCFIYNFWFCLWFNFFYGYRFSWFSCFCWYLFFICLFISITLKSFYTPTPLWLWSSCLILTFCWCCLAFSICCCLLVRR